MHLIFTQYLISIPTIKFGDIVEQDISETKQFIFEIESYRSLCFMPYLVYLSCPAICQFIDSFRN